MQPPRANHPSLSLPKPEASSSSAVAEDDEAINSDLDDSDTDGEEDADEIAIGAADIVFCTYDKVNIILYMEIKAFEHDTLIHSL